MRLFYPIKEIFLTVQGEGAHAGKRAVFVRVAGCNVWTGRVKDRERDTEKGCCAAWCDTDFVGTDGPNGGKLAADDIAQTVERLWAHDSPPFVVVTGGEPSLVLDDPLVRALHKVRAFIAVETNGSKELPGGIDWITLSPKPPMAVVDQGYSEVKVVYPVGFDPIPYERMAVNRFIQPCDAKDGTQNEANIRACLAFIDQNPAWRLSLQTHKIIGVP
jgi:7-carboxy-7-deazaguanine synthase